MHPLFWARCGFPAVLFVFLCYFTGSTDTPLPSHAEHILPAFWTSYQTWLYYAIIYILDSGCIPFHYIITPFAYLVLAFEIYGCFSGTFVSLFMRGSYEFERLPIPDGYAINRAQMRPPDFNLFVAGLNTTVLLRKGAGRCN